MKSKPVPLIGIISQSGQKISVSFYPWIDRKHHTDFQHYRITSEKGDLDTITELKGNFPVIDWRTAQDWQAQNFIAHNRIPDAGDISDYVRNRRLINYIAGAKQAGATITDKKTLENNEKCHS